MVLTKILSLTPIIDILNTSLKIMTISVKHPHTYTVRKNMATKESTGHVSCHMSLIIDHGITQIEKRRP